MRRIGFGFSAVGALYVLVELVLPSLGLRIAGPRQTPSWSIAVALTCMVLGGALEWAGRPGRDG